MTQPDANSFQRLLFLMTTLRGPNGCPWDREQSHASLTKYLEEETYEFLEAVAKGDTKNMCEELGDVLLQVIFHAQIAHEKGEFSIEDIRYLNHAISQVDLSGILESYTNLIQRLRNAGIAISDRRAVKFQKVIAASAIISGRIKAINSDMWILRNIWDTEEQQEIVTSIVNRQLKQEEATEKDHPRAHRGNRPDPESIIRDLESIVQKLADANCSKSNKAFLNDRLALITERCEWIENPEQRTFIQEQINSIWDSLEQ
jgi:MoxR-like ATPase